MIVSPSFEPFAATSSPALADSPRKVEQLRTVYQLTDAVNRARRAEEIYEAALLGLERALGTDRASILLFDSDGVMRFQAWHRLSDEYRAAVEGHSPWSRDTVDPQPVIVPDVSLDPALASFQGLFARESIGALAFIPLVSRERLIGKFMVYFPEPCVMSEEDVRLAQTIAGHVAFAVERKRVEEALEYLAGASAALDSSLDYGATLDEVARILVPYLGDWVLVETIGESGTLETASGAHADPALGPTLTRLLALRGAPGPDALARAAIDLGRTRIAPDAYARLTAEFGGTVETESLLHSLGHRAALALPLFARGRVLGAITLVSRARSFEEREVALAEDLGRRSAVALDNARLYREAQDSDRRKEEFLAVLAHELRNPLMPLLTCLELMRVADAPRESLQGWRAIMERQVRTLTRLVDDLLDVSRITRGKIELKKQSIDLANVIARAVETARPLYETKGVPLAVSVDPAIRFEADPLRLEQVLANLLHNAAKFTSDRGVVEVRGALEGGAVTVRVRDHGVGLPPDMVARVFDLFVQAGTPAGGLGIGLTLARTLVELHGGTVHAESAGPGQGTEFVVRLPVGRPTGMADPEPAAIVEASHASWRTLIVDDNVDGATALAEALRRRGHQVHVAHDGASALREAESCVPDLVLLDLGLPDLDGFEVAGRLKSLAALARTRIVAVSGYGQEQYQMRSAAMGFASHLVKPIDMAQLEAVLRRLAEQVPA